MASYIGRREFLATLGGRNSLHAPMPRLYLRFGGHSAAFTDRAMEAWYHPSIA
jgi:hypothetical protein